MRERSSSCCSCSDDATTEAEDKSIGSRKVRHRRSKELKRNMFPSRGFFSPKLFAFRAGMCRATHPASLILKNRWVAPYTSIVRAWNWRIVYYSRRNLRSSEEGMGRRRKRKRRRRRRRRRKKKEKRRKWRRKGRGWRRRTRNRRRKRGGGGGGGGGGRRANTTRQGLFERTCVVFIHSLL